MDLQCPAVVMCLAPQDEVPTEVGGRRVSAGYVSGGLTAANVVPFDWRQAPTGGVWSAILRVADLHRGEGVILVADAETLEGADLRGVALSVDSDGPRRIEPERPAGPVDNSGRD